MKSHVEPISARYPKGYEERNEKIYYGEEEVSNCIIKLKDYYYIENPNSRDKELYYKVLFIKSGEWQVQVGITIPSSKLGGQTAVKDKDLGEISFIMSKAQFATFFMKTLKLTTSNLTPRRYFKVPQGDFIINDKHGYVLGNYVVFPSDPGSYVNTCSYKIKDLPENVDNYMAISQLVNFNFFPAAAVIVSLTTFIMPFFDKEMQRKLQFAGYIYGSSGSGKSVVGAFVTDFFEDRENIISLLSDKDIFSTLSSFKGCPTMADDLCSIKSRNLKDKLEETAAKLVQLKQSGGHILSNGDKLRIDGSLIITAETVVKSICTINRCLLIQSIPADKDDDVDELEKLQPSFVKVVLNFIEWLYRNYNQLICEIPKLFDSMNPSYGNSSIYIGYKRVINTWKLLNVTLFIFVKFLTGDYENIFFNPIMSCFRSSIDECIKDTFAHIDANNCHRHIKHIINLANRCFSSKSSVVTKNDTVFYNRNVVNGESDVIYKDKDEGSFIISGTYLSEIFSGMSPTSAAKVLNDFGLLRLSDAPSEGNTYTIKGQSKNDRKYYHIDKDMLKELYRDYKDIECS